MIVDFFPPYAFDDVRLTDFDVLLARSDVQAANVVQKNYQSVLAIPGSPIVIPRGYVAADVTVGHKTYRVLNTHLEPFLLPGSPNFKLEQAMEMIADLQGETLPTVLLGDFNTAPGDLVYGVMEAYGFVDAWTRKQVKPAIPGYTSGHDSDLRNTVVDLNKRIDHIWVRSNVGVNGKHNIGPVF
jgi:endonuclease/exonuclease/phosphatase family metal-dependent hydrolase